MSLDPSARIWQVKVLAKTCGRIGPAKQKRVLDRAKSTETAGHFLTKFSSNLYKAGRCLVGTKSLSGFLVYLNKDWKQRVHQKYLVEPKLGATVVKDRWPVCLQHQLLQLLYLLSNSQFSFWRLRKTSKGHGGSSSSAEGQGILHTPCVFQWNLNVCRILSVENWLG